VGELGVLAGRHLEAMAFGGRVVVADPGPAAREAAARLAASLAPGDPVVLIGTAQAIAPDLAPGSLVVATELVGPDGGGHRQLPGARLVADELRRLGLGTRCGPVLTARPGPGAASVMGAAALPTAVAVDTFGAWAVRALGARPLAAVLAVTGQRFPAGDRPPGGAVPEAELRTLGALLRARPPLERWASATGPHTVVLASPRSFCAGVERAIAIVERSLERFGAPVFVRRQIVHNTHVVAALEAKGAVFVDELDQVPAGSTVVLAAHGVSPEVRARASGRGDLAVIDATCPLVAKVHREARRFAAEGRRIVLVGHADHEEVVGTMGEAPGRVHLVATPEDVACLPFAEDEPVGYLTQTTLATDETAAVVAALRRRFPALVGPSADDICYATQNRQDAVRAIAGRCDLVLVVGSANSSNTARLTEVARRAGCRAELLEDASALRLGWFEKVRTIGLTAGASAPEMLVEQVIDTIGLLGPLEVDQHATTVENVRFTLPPQVR
jgi:4-hydroxy-3-methylbut-2-enyl diphosphate reductase